MVPVMLTFYDADCKIVKERSRSRARPSSTVQTIFWPKKVLAGPLLFDQICFWLGQFPLAFLYHDQSLTDMCICHYFTCPRVQKVVIIKTRLRN